MLFATITALALACNNPQTSENKNVIAQQQEHFSLIGKEAVLKYPTLTAQVKYISATELHWKTTDAEGNTAEGTEKISYKQLNDYLFFLNWIEQDGTTVSQVIDLKDNKVTAYLSFSDENGRGGRSAEFLEGNVELK